MSKLAKVPVSRRGEVLLMRRLDLTTDNYNNAFTAGLTQDHASKLQGTYPARKLASSRSGSSVTTT